MGGVDRGGRDGSRNRIRRVDDELCLFLQTRQHPLNFVHELPPLSPHDLVPSALKSVGDDEKLLEVVGEDGGCRVRGRRGEEGVKLGLERSRDGERRGREGFERGCGTRGGLLRGLRE